MYPKQMVFLINEDFERRREQEWQEALRRPDALPLPPEEPAIDVRARLSAVVRGWLLRMPPTQTGSPAKDDEAPAL
jgi:broad specificity phosphatase PhoE